MDQQSVFTNYFIDGIASTNPQSPAFNSNFTVNLKNAEGKFVVLNSEGLAKRKDILDTDIGQKAAAELDQLHGAFGSAFEAHKNERNRMIERGTLQTIRLDSENYRKLNEQREELQRQSDEAQRIFDDSSQKGMFLIKLEGAQRRLKPQIEEVEHKIRMLTGNDPGKEALLKQDPASIAKQIEVAEQACSRARQEREAAEQAFAKVKKEIRASEEARNEVERREQKAPDAAKTSAPAAASSRLSTAAKPHHS